MFDIIINNPGLWLNILIPFAIMVYLIKTSREYAYNEFFIQICITVLYLLVMYVLLFSTTTNLRDTEFHNSQVRVFSYEEGYEYEYDCSYQSCTGSGNNRTCVTIPKTCESWKAPKYYVKTSTNETVHLTKNAFVKASKEFGKTEYEVYRSDQTISSKLAGEGDRWDSIPTKMIPISTEHTYDNFVKAAPDSILHSRFSDETFKDYISRGKLVEYPKLIQGEFSQPIINRVIDTAGVFSENDLNKLNKQMNNLAAKIGKDTQSNPLIYTTTELMDFKFILDAYWEKAKKNDVILLIGIEPNSKKIRWTDTIAWTDNDLFINKSTNILKDTSLNDIPSIVSKFEHLISNHYEGKPMKDFEFLKENISLKWYWQVCILLGNILISGFMFVRFLNNQHRK